MRTIHSAASRGKPSKNTRVEQERNRVRDLARLHDAWAVLTAGPAAGDAALLVAVLAASAVKS
jgi:hypothetical protein